MITGKAHRMLVWLHVWLLASLLLSKADGTNIFADCGNKNVVPPSGGSFEATGCNYVGEVSASFLGMVSGANASVLMKDGFFAAGSASGLSIQCSDTVISLSLGPLRITVTNFTFGQDAALGFIGVLPPNSLLLIHNNSFFLTEHNLNTVGYPGDFLYPLTSAILIGQLPMLTDNLVLSDGANLTIIDNIVTGLWAEDSPLAAVAVAYRSVALQNRSAIIISGNILSNVSVSSHLYVACFILNGNGNTGNTLTVDDKSTIEMNNNRLLKCNVTGTGNAYVALLSSTTGYSMALSNQSAVTMSGNEMLQCVVGNNKALVASLTLACSSTGACLTATGESTLGMNSNSLINSKLPFGEAYAARLYVSTTGSFVALGNQATVSLSNNSITNISHIGSQPCYTSYLRLESSTALNLKLFNMSGFSFIRNRLSESTIEVSGHAVYISIYNSANVNVTMCNQSFMNAIGNSIESSKSKSNEYAVYVALQGSTLTVALSNQSHVNISCNRISNSSVNSDLFAVYLYFLGSGGGGVDLSLHNRSIIDTSLNKVHNSNVGGRTYVVYWYLLSVALSGQVRLRISSDSLVAMSGNVLLNSSVKQFEAYVVYVYLYCQGGSGASLLLHNCSSVVLSSNYIEGSTVQKAYVAYLSVESNIGYSLVSLHGQSTVDMGCNTFARSSVSSNLYVAHLYLMGTTNAGLSLSSQALVNISFNSISNSSVSSYAFVAYLYNYGGSVDFVLTDMSTIAMSLNTVQNGSQLRSQTFSAFMALLSSGLTRITLLSESLVTLSGNCFQNSMAEYLEVYVVYVSIIGSSSTSLTLHNRSAMVMSNNQIVNSNVWQTFVAYLSVDSGRSSALLGGQSTVSMSSNSLVNSTVRGGNAYVAFLYAKISIVVADESRINMIGNSLANCSIGGISNVAYLYLLSGSNNVSLSLLNQSTIALNSNSYSHITAGSSTVSLCSIEVFGPIFLYDNAAIHMNGNSANGVQFQSRSPIQIGARNVTLVRASHLSVTGNLMYGPPGGFSSLLTVSSKNSAAGEGLSISGGSSLNVSSNNVVADAMVMNVTMKVFVYESSALIIVGNDVHGNSAYFLKLSSGLFLNALWLMHRNQIFASFKVNYSLASVSLGFTNGSSAVVQACGNSLSWESHKDRAHPSLHLQPAGLSVLAANCGASLTSSRSALASNSSSLSGTVPAGHSRSRSLTVPATDLSMSAPNSSSLTPNRSLSHSNTSKLSRTQQTEESATPSIIVSQSRDVSITLGLPVVPSIVPKPVAVETAAKVRDVAGVAVAVTAVASITGGQLGVANAMLRLADCSGSSDDDELPILVHPLRFSFGDRSYQRNAAGAVSDTLLVPLIVVAIALGPARLLIMWSRSVPSRTALVQMGWPTLLVLPFANLAEGIGATTVAALGSGKPFGVGMGVVALLVLLAFAGSWVWILARVVPRSRLQLVREEGAAGLGKRRAFLRRMVRPSHRWVPLAPAEGSDQRRISLADVERYGNAVGDKHWYYAELLSFLCSLAVGVCEGLPSSLCRERAVIALIPSLLQCGLAVLALIPLERYLQSLLALCLVPMYVVVAVKVFSDSASDEQLDTVMAVLSTSGNVIGLVIMSLGLAAGLWEIATSHRAKRRRLSSRINLSTPMLDIDDAVDSSASATSHGTRRLASNLAPTPPSGCSLDVPLLDLDSFSLQPTHEPIPDIPAKAEVPDEREATVDGPEDDANSERATVNSILAQLKEFEERLQLE